ncbi:hypothetical protein GMSM_19130 [Geomonas sp. Red276]
MTQKMVVTAISLNLREGPSLNARVLDILRQKEQVIFLEASADNYWFKVRREGGEVGWASHKFLTALSPPSDAPLWLRIAEGEKGVHEVPGFANNARIVQYLKSTSLGEPYCSCDETPWCSSFVNYCMEKAGYEGTDCAAARSWLEWGKRIDTPCLGCIAVLSREGGGHVGFYVGESAETVTLLGGNQGDRVCLAQYPKSRVLGYRIPTP